MAFRQLSVALVSAVLLSSCSGVIDPANNQVDNFEGDVSVGGAFIKQYSWGKNGEIEVTMTSVVPTPTNGPLAMYIGTPDSANNCFQLAGYVSQAIVNRKVQFGVLNKGSYCLAVYDPGVLTKPVHITGTFSYP